MNLKLFINAIVNKFLAVLFFFCFITALSFSPAYSATSPEVVDITPSLLIRITEFYPNPPDNGYEWIEVYNPSDTELDITGWYIDDSDETSSRNPCLVTTTIVSPRSYIALDFIVKGVLNNTGDEVRLLDSQKKVVASLSYKNVKADYSISLIDGVWEFSTPTKGAVNPVQSTTSEVVREEEEEINYPDNVKITEFMACPSKGENEWVEIYNDTGEELDLTGWKIDDIEDGGSSPWVLDEEKLGKSLVVKKDSYFVISGFSNRFNNVGGDSVRLLNPNGDLVDETSYETCQTGYSYALDDGEFKLTKTTTPGEENEIVEDEVVVEEEEEAETEAEAIQTESVGQVLSAQSANTANPDVKIPETFEIQEYAPEGGVVEAQEDIINTDDNNNTKSNNGIKLIVGGFGVILLGLIAFFKNKYFPLVLWCGLIFAGSSIPGASVSRNPLVDFIIHKSVHIVEYSVLFIFAYRAFNKRIFASFIFVIFYSLSDEFHQRFVPGRNGRIEDSLVDLTGAFLGFLSIWKFSQILPQKLKNWLLT